MKKYGDKQQGRVLPEKKTAEAKPEFTDQDRQELLEEQADVLDEEAGA